MRGFDRKSLSEFDGSNGKPAYAAYKERVFDVTPSRLWKDGVHQRRHRAGEDLTDDVELAPHGDEVFGRFRQVGVLVEGGSEEVGADST